MRPIEREGIFPNCEYPINTNPEIRAAIREFLKQRDTSTLGSDLSAGGRREEFLSISGFDRLPTAKAEQRKRVVFLSFREMRRRSAVCREAEVRWSGEGGPPAGLNPIYHTYVCYQCCQVETIPRVDFGTW
jgi:hypothetical protein